MRKRFMKALAVVLTLCMLPVPEAMVAYGDTGAARYVSDGDVIPSGYVSPDFNEEDFQLATASDAYKNFEYKGNNHKSKRMKSIYETDLVLTEDEVENGVDLPVNNEAVLEAVSGDPLLFANMMRDEQRDSEELTDADFLFDNYAEGMEYPNIDSSMINAQAVSASYLDDFNEVNKNSEKRIPSVYDHRTKRRLRSVIMGGTDLVKYLADQMTFGINPIYISPDYSTNVIHSSISEAIWQNQMILEEDKPSYNLTEWSNSYGRTIYYELTVNYEIPDPAERKRLQLEMLDKAEEIIDNVGLYTNGHYLEELYGINDYIIDHGSYAHEVADNNIDHTMQRKAYGILVEGSGVCSSYARAFQLVAVKAGFTCLVDKGYCSLSRWERGYHAWNMVCTEWQGDNYKKWMMVDPTWNDDENEAGQPRNTYLMIPKTASKRNRDTDGTAFSIRGKFSYINQDWFNFEYDYLRYSDHSADKMSDFTDKLCEYIRRGYVPRFFRCEWELMGSTMNYVCDQVYSRTGVALSMLTTGYDAYIVNITCERNDSPNELKYTTKGLSELKEVSGQYVESPLEYPSYMYGTKPAPEPEITEEERKADEEEARRIKEEEEKKRQEEERKKQEEEKRKQEEERKRQEEEKKRQEEEQKKKQEEERKKQEEEKKKQEEERKKQEEEQKKKEEEQKKQNQNGSNNGGGSGGGSGSGGSGGGSRRGGGGSGGGGGSSSGGGSKKSGGSSGGGGGSSAGGTKTQNNTAKTNSGTGWKQDTRGWWYQNADGSYPRNTWIKLGGVWYLFNNSGYMSTGWQKANGIWYFFSSTGAMMTDWVSDGGKWYYMNGSGAMMTGAWVQSGGKWYYMGADGAMLRNTKTPDGYTVKADGSL